MGPDTLRSAGILMIILPTVAYGGISILRLVFQNRSSYMDNRLRQRLWTAGHAHAGVFLILSLVALLYLDAAVLNDGLRLFVSWSIPGAAILVPAAFFFSVAAPEAKEPSKLIYLAYLGFLSLSAGLIVLGTGLLRAT